MENKRIVELLDQLIMYLDLADGYEENDELIIHMAETSTNGTVQMRILIITQITPNGKIVARIGKRGKR